MNSKIWLATVKLVNDNDDFVCFLTKNIIAQLVDSRSSFCPIYIGITHRFARKGINDA